MLDTPAAFSLMNLEWDLAVSMFLTWNKQAWLIKTDTAKK